MRTARLLIAFAAVLPSCTPPATAAPDAFPGAEGFGRKAQGGRGGAVIKVSNLNDSGPGSLRACIDAKGPRTCVFTVGGVIRFTGEPPVIRNPYLTIAGQTAPGGGILLTHAGGANGFTPLVVKRTHDVVVRHIRVRTDRNGEERGGNDAFTIEDSSNVILDHVSGSWALDENVNGQGQNDLITVSWSIFAEGIPRHDKCALLASDPRGPQRFSFVKNLCAHNGDRNPDANFPPDSCVEIVNNVFYNAGSQFAEIWESAGGTPVNIINNYFRAGPNTSGAIGAIDRQTIGSTGIARIYHSGNQLDGIFRMTTDPATIAVVNKPVCALASGAMPARQAYNAVLAGAGAFPRDGFDQKIVSEVMRRTGSIIAKDAVRQLPSIASGTPYRDGDGDGMSDAWEVANGLDPARNDGWGDADGDGWANLDEFLDHAHREVRAGRQLR
ncbi:pectate lyase [Tardibacter chloracetimidivorans]|uniref:Pectate lyase n=1 Tax=Tardibacter chloracetimidivorans TaxID=1921510 RepID=A0A1L3ZS14_9SPHN|nr:pectate lyase [Tardibacter chloracetimidivorans]API58409.1 pectate lyase [Tardibacter chloracetimidivorans]